MRLLLLFAMLDQAFGQTYKAFSNSRQRTSLLGPFPVASQDACQLACDCARGDASGSQCDQFSGVVPAMNCWIYYFSKSHCTFLGEYTPNTCQLPIVEYQLQEWLQSCQATSTNPFITATTQSSLTTLTTPKATTSIQTTTPQATTGKTSEATTPLPGVWSEWVTTGTCPATCGSCYTAVRTRQCTGGGACDGLSSDVGPCGIALCPFPTPTCCSPYVKSLNSFTNTFYCGP